MYVFAVTITVTIPVSVLQLSCKCPVPQVSPLQKCKIFPVTACNCPLYHPCMLFLHFFRNYRCLMRFLTFYDVLFTFLDFFFIFAILHTTRIVSPNFASITRFDISRFDFFSLSFSGQSVPPDCVYSSF